MTDSPSTAELLLVARHGSTDLTQALAIVQLARRFNRIEEIHSLLGQGDRR